MNRIKDRVGATSHQNELWKNACRLSDTESRLIAFVPEAGNNFVLKESGL